MKKTLFTLSLAAVAALSFQSCKKEGCTDATANNYNAEAKKDDGTCLYGSDENKDLITIEGSISENLYLTNDKKYLLKGFVYLKEGYSLKIQAGTIIKGDKDSKGTLIIERGAKLFAQGTANNPIIFTSNQPEGARDYGDWGGLIVCGKAPINLPGGEGVLEGGTNATFGGTDAADNSGVISYVRIEFCGIAFQPNQEINGLTMGGVGSGTQIDHVQISYSGDDAFEWFGGTVNCKNLIVHRTWDDMFDTDNGFNGTIQYALGLSDPNVADQSGSNGFESDNDGQGNSVEPYTSPTFVNVSILGPRTSATATFNSQFKRAAHLRRATKQKIYNTLLAGFPDGLLVDGTKAEANANAGDLVFSNSIIAGCANALKVNSGSSFAISTWYAANSNQTIADLSELKIEESFNLTAPNFLPATGSALLSGAKSVTGTESTSFIGAFGTENWTATWSNFDPQTPKY
ncbi:MAG: T9SS C-terminal target domain-containing protein [Bacteroidota bacterium]